MRINADVEAAPPPRGRLVAGLLVLLTVNLGGPFVWLPLVAASSLSTAMKAVVGGAILVVAELSLPVVVAILGKPGFVYLRDKALGLIGRYGPPEKVGPIRYRIGLAMFGGALLYGLLEPYVGHHIGIHDGNRYWFVVASDIILLSSLFVLGGEFWDKVRALFVQEAVVQFPAAETEAAESQDRKPS